MRVGLLCLGVFGLSFVGLPGQCRLIDVNASPRTPIPSEPRQSPAFPGNTYVSGFVRCGRYWFLTAKTCQHGRELWRTDGTANGTTLVSDIRPGPGDSDPRHLICCKAATGRETLFFSANDGTNGTELWSSDGTASGTKMAKDIWPGGSWSTPDLLECMNGRVYFAASDGTTGNELWCSDGTASGTFLVKDIQPGSRGSSPRSLRLNDAGTEIYFSAQQDATGRELWKTGGNLATTQIVLDIDPGRGGSHPSYFVNHNGRTLFSAFTVQHGTELWATGGTAATTMLVQDLLPGPRGSGPRLLYPLAVCGRRLFFSAQHATDGTELWETDGSSSGTKLAANIAPDGANSDPSYLQKLGSTKILLSAKRSDTGREPFLFDCATNKASLVKDIYPGSRGCWPADFFEIPGGRAILRAVHPNTGFELFVTDGTPAGTSLLKDISWGLNNSHPAHFTRIGASSVLMSAADWTPSTGQGMELWVSDGTTAGTKLFKDIEPSVKSPSGRVSNPASRFGAQLLFQADDGKTGSELYTLDASDKPRLVKDLVAGNGSSSPSGFMTCWVGNRAISFFAATDTRGREPWVSDGTAAGTIPLGDLYPGATGSEPREFTFCKDNVFFTAKDPQNDRELWVSDGTPSGTKVVDFSRIGADPRDLVCCRGRLYFNARTAAAGYELMTSDGTVAGTRVVKDIYPGATSSFPNEIVCCTDRRGEPYSTSLQPI